jgi:hypothetical protein
MQLKISLSLHIIRFQVFALSVVIGLEIHELIISNAWFMPNKSIISVLLHQEKWALGAQVCSGSKKGETIKLGNRVPSSFTHSCSESECMTIPIDMHNVGDLHWNLVRSSVEQWGATGSDFAPSLPLRSGFQCLNPNANCHARTGSYLSMNIIVVALCDSTESKKYWSFLLPAPKKAPSSNLSTCQDRCCPYFCHLVGANSDVSHIIVVETMPNMCFSSNNLFWLLQEL